MFDWVLNNHKSEVDDKDTRRSSLTLFLCFYCWPQTNFGHWMDEIHISIVLNR